MVSAFCMKCKGNILDHIDRGRLCVQLYLLSHLYSNDIRCLIPPVCTMYDFSFFKFLDVVEFCEEMANEGKIVIVAALDGTFERKGERLKLY